MRNIHEFFKRIGGVYAKEIAKREVVRRAIEECAQVEVQTASISFTSGAAVIKGISHGARSAIYIRKQQILDCVKALDPSLHISDIR